MRCSKLHFGNYILCSLILISVQCHATVYTFETAGDYTDASNWDIYPGTGLYSNDTISIEADCININLDANDGYLVFTEDVSQIGISDLSISDECQVEILAEFFQIDISGYFFYFTNNQILLPNTSFIMISNFNSGIEFNSCPIWEYAYVEYYNFGTQDAFLIECMDGVFHNDGTINVSWNTLDLNCELNLSSGTIEGAVPFTLNQFNGNLNQNCPSCSATINNVSSLILNGNNNIQGTVTLNPPD